MIKINEEFSTKNYGPGWELHHTTPTTDKDGNPKMSTKVSFHPSFRMVGNAVLDRAIGDCNDLKEVLVVLEETKMEILKACMQVSK